MVSFILFRHQKDQKDQNNKKKQETSEMDNESQEEKGVILFRFNLFSKNLFIHSVDGDDQEIHDILRPILTH